MGYAYQADGSVICTGDADPSRTATYAGPKNSAQQVSQVAAFFALEPAIVPVPGDANSLTNSVTVAYLLANYPASATYRGKYIRVSDYAGSVDRVLRCDYDSASNLYFWQPTQTDYARPFPLTGNASLLALKNPNLVMLTGSVPSLTTWTVTIDLANRRPGEIIEIRNSMTSLLGTLNLFGTGLGTLLFNTLGGYARSVVDYSSGSAQLVRLQ